MTRAIEQHLNSEPIVVTTLPVTSDLVGRIPAKRWLYYCVDDFASWPGLDNDALRQMERKLLSVVDDVAVVSESLAARAREAGHEPMMLTHGIDLEMWARSEEETDSSSNHILKYIEGLPKPCAVFWGLIDPRIDIGAVRELAGIWQGSIVFVGPTQGMGDELASMENIHRLGAVARELLPKIGKLADVLVMPYRKCEVTKSMQPLKLLEYLATNKPVVCTDIPALNAWGDCCDVVSNSDFACRVCEVYERGLTENQKNNRNRRLPNESWQNKARMLEIMIDTPLEASVSMSGTITRVVHE